ncbi:MAG TPA: discoidin domain-containing protein, partial [Bacillota bacterium]|nr:discoidin domain-containing protein [Bacillota bacterium]
MMRFKTKNGLSLCLILLLALCLALPEVAMTTPGNGTLAAVQILTGSTTNLLQPASNLTDGDLQTYWGIKPGSTEGFVTIIFGAPSLIHGIALNGEVAGNSVLAVEYSYNGQWIPFTTGYLRQLPSNGIVDLSRDQAVTAQLRLRLTGPDISSARLTELKVMGEAAGEVLQRIQPEKLSASSNTLPTCPAEFLSDRNTYTTWQTNPGRSRFDYQDWDLDRFLDEAYFVPSKHVKPKDGWNRCPVPSQGEVIFELGSSYRIHNLNIYFANTATGSLQVYIPSGTSWRRIGEIPKQPVGWYCLDLSAQAIITGQVKVIAGGGQQGAGGIGEIEFWGYGQYAGNQRETVLLHPESAAKTLKLQP